MYEEGRVAEHHLKFAEAERLWCAALKIDMDDVHCDPFYLATDWGLFYPVTNIRPFGGCYDVIVVFLGSFMTGAYATTRDVES